MITKYQQLLLERRETHKYGLGVYALKDIPQYTKIASFDGPIRTAQNINELPTAEDNEEDGFCIRHAVQCGSHQWRDGKVDGFARYLAHSCNPNCGIMGLYTLITRTHINAGEELTWDYATAEEENEVIEEMKCICRSPLCRGMVGSFSISLLNKYPTFIMRNIGFISAWLVMKYGLY